MEEVVAAKSKKVGHPRLELRDPVLSVSTRSAVKGLAAGPQPLASTSAVEIPPASATIPSFVTPFAALFATGPSWCIDLSQFALPPAESTVGRYRLEQLRLGLRSQLARERRDVQQVSDLVEDRRTIAKGILNDLGEAIVALGGEAILEDSDLELLEGQDSADGSGVESRDTISSLPIGTSSEGSAVERVV